MAPRSRRSPQGKEPTQAGGLGSLRDLARPVFAQPEPTEDPTVFRTKHASDTAAYTEIDQLNKEHKLHPLPFPLPRGLPEPRLTLERALGDNARAVQTITKNSQIVFHATGDCGSTRGPKTQNEVVDKMVSDFANEQSAQVPQFALLLGDIVYSFGETQYYYDQFYEPYRDYPAPILAVAGNHDGMVAPHLHVATLEAFLRNFCADRFLVTPDAGGLSRTAQIQPGVFYTFDAPFVRVLAFYSNTLEDPGYIAHEEIGDSQIKFLRAALARVKSENYSGALIFAHHHPPYTASRAGSRHGWSVEMLAAMDNVCQEVGVWPHAVLAGHVHSYQRFTRTRRDGTEIPYISCGNGGHNVTPLARKGSTAIRTPQVIQQAGSGKDKVIFENYDDRNYGYLRVIVTGAQLRVEYHAASDGPDTKAPDDSATVDLATRRLTHFVAPDLGHGEAASEVRRMRAAYARRRHDR
jgi:Calcineurin-like phosphoesterase